ncbi:aminopeptidase [Viridibacillus sp. FSL R5-0477]|uniref:Aminopeptidase n=1 Tax=Viridibacillus arenosi FSL R5-213 TaxID=1227360 RepID=W4F8W1_9BACL|nr:MULTISPECIES: aminopeptidase [Viridibacillus]ETT88777.1 aminopeptidase [Viridibacillus arenosi FSL R5-213]OMC79130.1 aminopeptidase [Viridibacillus sp. FSL H8-0123]OMC83789.1 aminopeptidase [Viridibacillus sp. FSL H7-0596]OMC88309.1 aminopeptidase [Viridibacillus arenosi]
MTFQEKLAQFAELAVKVGVNIQKGQTLLINTTTDTIEFTRLVVKEAYAAGAGRVTVNFSDGEIDRAFFDNAPEDEFAKYPRWISEQRDELIERKGALLWIDAADPDLLSGVPVSKLSAQQKAAGKALANYRNAVMNDKVAWAIIAVPSKQWAAKVFPNLEADKQVEALWEAIFKTVRIGEGNAVENWQGHLENLDTRAAILNAKRFVKLHYTAPGTDLTIELPDKHIWQTGASKTPENTSFVANMPTEEVYTMPSKYGVDGFVSNTKPLVFQGNIIDDFKLTFENGKIVKAEAGVGNDLLQELIKADEGSKYLGEVALVPHESPISASNILYYNTLFDENASNHLAIGEAYPTCYEDGSELSPEQLEEHGINTSITHEDFMIGSADMNIDGVLEDGTIEPIFRNGSWAF